MDTFAPSTAVTENGAPARSTTLDECLDLFYGLVRGISGDRVRELVDRACEQDPELTLQILLHARDTNGCGEKGARGKGERLVVYLAMIWLREWKPNTYQLMLPHLLTVGSYRDLRELACMAIDRFSFPVDHELVELTLLADHLLEVETALDSKDEERIRALGPKTLAGKWAPSAGSQWQKRGKLVTRLVRMLYPEDKFSWGQRQYRKLLSRQRKYAKVVERLMCTGEWDKIRFQAVPSRAMARYSKKAFPEHLPEEWKAYKEALKKGEVKVCAKGMDPHELVRQYLTLGKELDDIVEAQWSTIVEKVRESGTFQKVTAVVDVSGSMHGIPMEVAIALGIMVATLTKGEFANRLITFSESPQWHIVRGETLKNKVSSLKGMEWGMNTNFLKVFQLILNIAVEKQLRQTDLPDTLFVFSDMQFDLASGSLDAKTTWQAILTMFQEAGYTPPGIIFWNLRGNTVTFPAFSDEEGVKAMLSGFSADLLRLFLDGEDLTPIGVMKRAVSCYQVSWDPNEF